LFLFDGVLDGSRVGCFFGLEVALTERPSCDPSPRENRFFGRKIPIQNTSFKTPVYGQELIVNMSMKLYVGNLSFQTSNADLEELFATIGTVESATVVDDRETGRSRGFGFVEMASQEDGERAIAQLNGTEFGGREIKVNEAKPREDRSRGAYGGGRSNRW
jgi:RNA recognition motif-containing protein